MLPDQWPTAVQADIAKVREAVAGVSVVLLGDIAADIDAVRLAVQQTTNALLGEIAGDIEAVRASVQKVELATETVRAALLGEIETTLVTVRKAVNAGPGGDVWVPGYNYKPPDSRAVATWFQLSSIAGWEAGIGSWAGWTRMSVRAGVISSGITRAYAPYSTSKFGQLLVDAGRVVVPVPDPTPPGRDDVPRWWLRAWRALRRQGGPYRDGVRVTG